MAVTFVGVSTAESTANSTSETATAVAGRAVGDALFAVVTSISSAGPGAVTYTNWTLEDAVSAPHARWVLRRTATNTSDDDLTFTTTNAGSIGIIVCCYRGIDPTAWVKSAQGWENDSSSPYLAPFSLGTFDVGASPGAFLGVFSAQQAGTKSDDGVITLNSGGTLRAYTSAERDTFAGGMNAIADALNVTGAQAIDITYSGTSTVSAFSTIYFYNVTQVVTIPIQGPFDPVRANARMDALSVAETFNAPPIDVSVGQEFLPEPLETIDQDTVLAFDESLTPGTIEFYYLPLAEQSDEYLQKFGGETMLARMARVYPPAIMTRCQDVASIIITANLDSDNAVEARYVIEYVFSLWAAQYPWFNYDTIPDLRIPLVGFTNADYGAGDGVIKSDVIWISQLDDQERTMLDIVQEFLAPFGAHKTVNDNNELVIRARYGPDASTAAEVTLKDNDLYSLSVGAASRTGTKNRITTTQDLFDRAADTPVMQDAYLQKRDAFFDPTEMITDRVSDPPDAIPGSRLDLTGGSGGSVLYGYGALEPLFWPARTDVLPDKEISWEDSGATLQLDVDYKAYLLSSPATNIIKSLVDSEVTLSYANTVVGNGWQTLCTATYTNTGIFLGVQTMFVALQGRWVNEPPNRRGIELRLGPSRLALPGMNKGGTDYYSPWVGTFAFTLSDASTAFTRRGQRNVTFGVLELDEPDYLPGASGTNAIETSQDALGIIEETINIGPYSLTLETQQAMTEGILLDKIQPRAVRTANQSVVRAFPVRFSHVGKRVAVPDDAGGTVEGEIVSRSYTEGSPFVGGSGVLESRFSIMITETTGNGAVDTTSNFLLLEDGGTILLQDSTGVLIQEA